MNLPAFRTWITTHVASPWVRIFLWGCVILLTLLAISKGQTFLWAIGGGVVAFFMRLLALSPRSSSPLSPEPSQAGAAFLREEKAQQRALEESRLSLEREKKEDVARLEQHASESLLRASEASDEALSRDVLLWKPPSSSSPSSPSSPLRDKP